MVTSRDEDLSDYTLPAARHEEIRAQLKAEMVDSVPEAAEPKVIILAGQPGAGKSGLKAQAMRDFPADEPPVEIDIDELRNSHDDYERLSLEDDRTAANHVQHDAGRWGDALIEDARDGRRNIIIDGTLKSPDKAQDLCERFNKAGYQVEVHAMAVRFEDSQLGIHKRYHDAKANDEPGRWVPMEIHDAAYTGMEKSLDRLKESDSVAQIEVHGRPLDGTRGTRLLSEGAPGVGDPVSALNSERERPRTPVEQLSYDSDMRAVHDMILDQDKDLTEPENQAFVERARAHEQDRAGLTRDFQQVQITEDASSLRTPEALTVAEPDSREAAYAEIKRSLGADVPMNERNAATLSLMSHSPEWRVDSVLQKMLPDLENPKDHREVTAQLVQNPAAAEALQDAIENRPDMSERLEDLRGVAQVMRDDAAPWAQSEDNLKSLNPAVGETISGAVSSLSETMQTEAEQQLSAEPPAPTPAPASVPKGPTPGAGSSFSP